MKTTIKNFALAILVAIGLFNLFATNGFVFAQTYNGQHGAQQLCQDSDCPITEPSQILTKILKPIVQWTYTAFFVVAVLFILIAAFNFLTAQGDPTKINSARSQILWACVAIAIALISVGAAQIIQALIK